MLAVALWAVLAIQDGDGMVGNCVPTHLEQPMTLVAQTAVPRGCKTASTDAARLRTNSVPGTTWAGSPGFYGCSKRKERPVTGAMLGCASALLSLLVFLSQWQQEKGTEAEGKQLALGTCRSYKSLSECVPEALTSGFKCLLTSQIMKRCRNSVLLVRSLSVLQSKPKLQTLTAGCRGGRFTSGTG